MFLLKFDDSALFYKSGCEDFIDLGMCRDSSLKRYPQWRVRPSCRPSQLVVQPCNPNRHTLYAFSYQPILDRCFRHTREYGGGSKMFIQVQR